MKEIETLPSCDMKSFARWLTKTVELYFENPENQRRFEEWQREKRKEAIEYDKRNPHS